MLVLRVYAAFIHFFLTAFFTCSSSLHPTYVTYKMAKAFGGDPTRQGTCSGADVSMKLYLPDFLHCAARALRSHISPIESPNMLRKYWCRTGQSDSQLVVSRSQFQRGPTYPCPL